MSIRRIESIYATCMDRTEMTCPQMAVLLALGFCANAETERCFPSKLFLAKLTHCGESTVERACSELRKAGLIDWRKGGMGPSGLQSNSYVFTFPHRRMGSRREGYQQLTANPPSERGYATPTARVVPPRSEGYPPPERGGKSVGTQKEIGSEVGSDRTDAKISFERPTQDGVTTLQAFSLPRAATAMEASALQKRAGVSLVREAMRVCGVRDADNARVFSSEMCRHDQSAILECIFTLESELRAGEHAQICNLAALLMRRIKSLPKIS